MEQRGDDTEPVIRRRLEVYKAAAQPVERYYQQRLKLLNFEITGGAAGGGAGQGQQQGMHRWRKGADSTGAGARMQVTACCPPAPPAGGIPQTLPRLLDTLRPHMEPAAQQVQKRKH